MAECLVADIGGTNIRIARIGNLAGKPERPFGLIRRGLTCAGVPGCSLVWPGRPREKATKTVTETATKTANSGPISGL